MDDQPDLPLHESELQQLIAPYARDPLSRAILMLDLAIRRSVRRLLGPSEPRGPYSTHP